MGEDVYPNDQNDLKSIRAATEASIENKLLQRFPEKTNTKQKVLDRDYENSCRDKEKLKNIHKTKIYDLRIIFAWISMTLVIFCTCLLFFLLFAQGLGCISLQALKSITNTLIGLSSGLILGFFLDYFVIERREYKVFRILAPVILSISLLGITIKRTYVGVYDFNLDNNIIITVIISFIVNIIGLLAAVFFWLYPQKNNTK